MNQIQYGFGNATNPLPLELSENELPNWKQVHGVSNTVVKSSGQACGEVDALITRHPNLPIAIRTADCVPILMASESLGVAITIHAGWRGTLGRIIEKTWDSLPDSEKQNPSAWNAWIGPSIRKCCYEVSEDLFAKFESEFTQSDFSKKNYLDLADINMTLLQALGIQNVNNLAECTYCTKESGVYKFNSYRRESSNLRQFSAIRLVPES